MCIRDRLVLDLHPDRRGMASSLQAFIASTANGLVAGVIAPLVMHSTVGLALACISMLSVGLLAWLWLHQRWPEIGRAIEPVSYTHLDVYKRQMQGTKFHSGS